MAVSSNTTTASKIDRGEIMRTAWAQTKGFYAARGRAFTFSMTESAWALHCAWHDVGTAEVAELQA